MGALHSKAVGARLHPSTFQNYKSISSLQLQPGKATGLKLQTVRELEILFGGFLAYVWYAKRENM